MMIRQMLITDYEKVYSLWMSCKGVGLNSVDDSREGIKKFLAANPGTCFVAAEGDDILGCILIGTDGRRGYIYHLAVSPSRRKEGIGKALVEKGLDACRVLGITKTALVAFKRNEDGIRFWNNLGFKLRDDLIYQDYTLTQITYITP